MPDPVRGVVDNGSPVPDAPPLPAFLQLDKGQIQQKFIDLEWEQRNRLMQGRQQADNGSQWALLSGDEIAARNRYANVEVFAKNRVKLQVGEGQSDYINASPIKLLSTKSGQETRFIATQGPKEGIHGHIWRMVWQECADPAVIVMLTQTHESGREKCFQYFPGDMENPTLDITEDDEFEDDFKATLTLKSVTEDATTQSTIREMELQTKDGQCKTVWHLLFSGWPDFSIPEDESREALVKLIRLSADKNAQRSSPRVVHCSAGVGRSGTFIALDWLMAELEEGSLDDIRDDNDPVTSVVDELRQQRMMMVQSDSQYNFLYDLMRQLWKERQQGGSKGSGQVAKADTPVPDMAREELEKEIQGNVAKSVFVPFTTDA